MIVAINSKLKSKLSAIVAPAEKRIFCLFVAGWGTGSPTTHGAPASCACRAGCGHGGGPVHAADVREEDSSRCWSDVFVPKMMHRDRWARRSPGTRKSQPKEHQPTAQMLGGLATPAVPSRWMSWMSACHPARPVFLLGRSEGREGAAREPQRPARLRESSLKMRWSSPRCGPGRRTSPPQLGSTPSRNPAFTPPLLPFLSWQIWLDWRSMVPRLRSWDLPERQSGQCSPCALGTNKLG